MTNRETMQQALEALENIDKAMPFPVGKQTITALKAALEQPEQEPLQAEQIGWAVQGCSKMWRGEFAEIDAKAEAKRIGGTCVAFALYTEPPQRSWVGLTKEDKFEIAEKLGLVSVEWLNLMQVIEDKLKERNCE